MANYPNNLRELRRARGLSLEQVAEQATAAGCAMVGQTLSKLERGALRLKTEQLAALAAALDCTIDEIMPGAAMLTAQDRALLDVFHSLDPTQRETGLQLLQTLKRAAATAADTAADDEEAAA